LVEICRLHEDIDKRRTSTWEGELTIGAIEVTTGNEGSASTTSFCKHGYESSG